MKTLQYLIKKYSVACPPPLSLSLSLFPFTSVASKRR